MSKILLALGTLVALNGVALADTTYSAAPSYWVSPRLTDQGLSPSLSANADATPTFSIGVPASYSSGANSPANRIGHSLRD